MKKLKSSRGETLIESLCAILIVTLVMLFLSTAVVTAAKINRQLRDVDVSFAYEGAESRKEEEDLTVSYSGNDAVIFQNKVTLITTGNGYRYYRYQGGTQSETQK